MAKYGDFEVIELLPANGTGAPISPQVSTTVYALLRNQRMGLPIDRKLLASRATGEFCEKFSNGCLSRKPLQRWPLGKEFVPNRPYGLADGRVRIEWMWNGKLEFLSLITFKEGKVADLFTAPAEMPIETNR
ncbi:hypothetical protein [Sphingomonas limnosediminicola]|uniref:hypothetical protein n=1 Tax=Sphingomonas limnosediminicola TaxID=940133 RepID=UPI0031DEA190